MVLKWIRRKAPALDKELKDYLFTEIACSNYVGFCSSTQPTTLTLSLKLGIF